MENDLRPGRLSQPVVTPLFERQIRREEIPTFFRQYILIPAGMFRQRNTGHDPCINEFLQAGTENIRGYSDVVLEFIEAFDAVIGLAQQQDRPPVPHSFHGASHRAFLVGNTASLHIGHCSLSNFESCCPQYRRPMFVCPAPFRPLLVGFFKPPSSFSSLHCPFKDRRQHL